MGIFTISSDKLVEECRKRLGNKSVAVHIFISDEIEPKSKDFKNKIDGRILLPPPNIMANFINTGDIDEYEIEYIKYLNSPEVAPYLTSYMLMAFDTHVGLLCSSAEKEYKYMEILKKYLQEDIGFGEYCKRYTKYIKRNLFNLNRQLNKNIELKEKVNSMHLAAVKKSNEAKNFI